MTLVELLKNSVAAFREKPALIMRPRYRTIFWTYNDLAHYALGVAKLLQEKGVGQGEAVLLWSPNSPYWVAAFFGILLRRGVVVPLHVENTQEFIKKVAAETGARLLLKSSLLKSDIQGLEAVDIDQLPPEKAGVADLEKFPSGDESRLAEIVYTSGTTGDPKGVMLTHKNILSNLEALRGAIPITSRDRLLSILPLSHMFEQTAGMLFPLLQGAGVMYIPRISSGLITAALLEHQATKLLAVPQFLDTVMKKIEARAKEERREKVLARARRIAELLPFALRRLLFRKVHKRFGGKLTTVASGGAPLDPVLEKKWELLGIRLLQGYGLTETSPVVSANTYQEHRFSSIGKPLKNVEVRIASDGEILIRGPSVFSGYFKNEAKTKEAFTPDGWFRTGDLGELDRDGFLYIRGRKKYLILGPAGQNVYPEDIEFELAKEPGVKDSAVVGLEKDHRVEIHAVLLLEEGADPDRIVEAASKRLADFQRIQNYSIWPEADFPRSATRKIQKEKVMTWLKGKKQEARPRVAEITQLAKLLGEIFEKEPAEISPETRLVKELGLDSILRIELVTRIEEQFGVEIEEKVITEQTRVLDLEKLIREIPPMPPKPALRRWPFSFPTGIVRAFLHAIFIQPLLFLFVDLHVRGKEVFRTLAGPALIMPNHRSYIDSPVLFRSLPGPIRFRIAFATAADMLRYFWFFGPTAKLFYAAFPFPREEGENIEAGLEAVGRLLDRGWSVAVFPEGRMSKTREFMPLKRGAGLLAIEMRVPVVPVFIDGTEQILPWGKVIPRKRSGVSVYFGAPLYFGKQDSVDSATEKIARSLEELKRSAS